MTSNSDYINDLLSMAKECSEGDEKGRDKYHKAAHCFFETIQQEVGPCDQRSAGDRTFFSKAFQCAIIKGFESINGIVAEKEPRIIWDKRKDNNFPNKRFDIIAYNEQSKDKAVVIEIKGRNFDPMAAALMEIGAALRYGRRIETGNISISPFDCCFTVLLADCTKQDETYFKMLSPLIQVDGYDPELYCIFRNDLVNGKKTDEIFKAVYRFYREYGTFLSQ